MFGSCLALAFSLFLQASCGLFRTELDRISCLRLLLGSSGSVQSRWAWESAEGWIRKRLLPKSSGMKCDNMWVQGRLKAGRRG